MPRTTVEDEAELTAFLAGIRRDSADIYEYEASGATPPIVFALPDGREIADPAFVEVWCDDASEAARRWAYVWYWYRSSSLPGIYVCRGLGGDVDGGTSGYYRATPEVERIVSRRAGAGGESS